MPPFVGYLDFGATIMDDAALATPSNRLAIGCWGIGQVCPETIVLAVTLDFSINGQAAINVGGLIQDNKIDFVRTVYFYNDTGFPIGGYIPAIEQKFNFPTQYFGFMPLMIATDQDIEFTADPAVGIVKMLLLNTVHPMQFDFVEV